MACMLSFRLLINSSCDGSGMAFALFLLIPKEVFAIDHLAHLAHDLTSMGYSFELNELVRHPTLFLKRYLLFSSRAPHLIFPFWYSSFMSWFRFPSFCILFLKFFSLFLWRWQKCSFIFFLSREKTNEVIHPHPLSLIYHLFSFFLGFGPKGGGSPVEHRGQGESVHMYASSSIPPPWPKALQRLA